MKSTYRTPAANVRGDVVTVTLSLKPNSGVEDATHKISGGASLSFGL